jgi:hypothetical protein
VPTEPAKSPLSGVKRTSVDALQMSAFDPKRTSGAVGIRAYQSSASIF